MISSPSGLRRLFAGADKPALARVMEGCFSRDLLRGIGAEDVVDFGLGL
jgi:hypothetical protein